MYQKHDIYFALTGMLPKAYPLKPLGHSNLRQNELRAKLKTCVSNNGGLSLTKSEFELDKKSPVSSMALHASRFAQVIFVDESTNKFLLEILSDKHISGIPTVIVNTEFNKDTDPVLDRLKTVPSIAAKVKLLDLRSLQPNIYYTRIDDFEKYASSALEYRKFCYMFLTAARKHRAHGVKVQRALEAEGRASKGDGLDNGHRQAYSKGGSADLKNIKLQSPSTNRSFSRNADSSMKSERSKKGK